MIALYILKALAGCALAIFGLLMLWIGVAAGVEWFREVRLAWRHYRWKRARDEGRLGV